MIFLRSCKIIYEDFTVKQINQCDGFFSIFSMPNISSVEFLIILTCLLITLYFILKTILLFKKD